jgi:hypothetical protein
VNNVAHADIRASAQSLLTLVTVGLGMWLGAMIFKFFKIVFTVGPIPADEFAFMMPVYTSLKQMAGTMSETAGATHWSQLFLVPCILTAACAVAYLVFFKPSERQLAAEGAKV